jgi:putative membrane protein
VLLRILIRLVVLAVAIWLTTLVLPGVEVTGGWATYLWVALIFAVVNAILGPILHLLALPFTVITLGLFALVVNAGLLAITAGLSSHLDLGGFWSALFGAILIAVFGFVLNLLVPDPT